MDATFDQLGSVAKFTQMLKDQNITDVFSFDLTAATDRLPMQLQELILEVLSGDKKIAQDWRRLLTDRWYELPPGLKDHQRTLSSLGIKPEWTENVLIDSKGLVTAVKYATGQPIGCLSS